MTIPQTKPLCASVLLLLLALAHNPFLARSSNPALPDTPLLETGGAAKAARSEALPAELKIVSYNMRWRGGDDLQRLIRLLKDDEEIGGAAVIGLQEVDRHKKRTNFTNTAREMAEALGMYYVWAAPPPPEGKEGTEEETGVAILSRYPLADVQRIVLPHEGPGGRRRAAVGATVQLGNQKSLRVYSVHAETRTSNEKRLQQFEAVLADLEQRQGTFQHSIVLGDFNTVTGKDVGSTTRLFKERGFQTPFPDNLSTWKTLFIELKLDWLWLKGLDASRYGIDKQVKLSDHWPLWAVVKIANSVQ